MERDARHQGLLLHNLQGPYSRSLVNEPLSRFPSGIPMEGDAHHQSPFLHNLQGPQ